MISDGSHIRTDGKAAVAAVKAVQAALPGITHADAVRAVVMTVMALRSADKDMLKAGAGEIYPGPGTGAAWVAAELLAGDVFQAMMTAAVNIERAVA